MLAGLAEVAAGAGLDAGAGDARTAGGAVRHWLEADGERCLLVFDNAADPELLRPFIPAAGAAPGDHHQQPAVGGVAGRGRAGGRVHRAEALTFLAARTGQADAAGARCWRRSWGFCRWRWRRPRR